jgi:putative ATP-dependent endonuclease of OLD family
VFFSSPLDLDLAMLKAFPAAYAATIPPGGGPELTVEESAKAVLSQGGLAAYDGDLEDHKALFPAYRYHFLTHSKPATHLRALLNLDDEAIKKSMPACLRPLIQRVKTHLRRD